jgi:hypothetical protein
MQLAISETMNQDALSNIAAFADNSGSSLTYMRFSKGEFTYGADNDVIDDDVEFVPDMSTLSRGYVCWVKASVAGEVMSPIASGKRITEADLPDYGPYEDGDGWREQTSIEFRRVPDGARFMFKTSSRGGTQALQKLSSEFAARMKVSKEFSLPIITMTPDSYKHERYGKIHVPKFTVVGWTATAANDSDEIVAEIVDEKPAKAKRDSVLG